MVRSAKSGLPNGASPSGWVGASRRRRGCASPSGSRERWLPAGGTKSVARLFHPDELAAAQAVCIKQEADDSEGSDLFVRETPRSAPIVIGEEASVDWAAAYFVATWMGRGGQAGTKSEFNQSLAVRWGATGGTSARRFQSAIESLAAWGKALGPWEFVCLDAFAFLDLCKDRPGHAVYVDAPWPDAGDGYKHRFPDVMQRRLAIRLRSYEHTKVVVRYGDHPLIRELYPEDGWIWHRHDSRDMHNGTVSEVLLVRRNQA